MTSSNSNALWGQLLRKGTTASAASQAVPMPTAPLDKTSTSMRILLHDTQANFERFSVRVDSLSTGIEEAKREIIVVKDLFHGAQESLTADIVDLVNRCQTQIQKSVGDPAQATALELFRKNAEARLDGLSKRIDDMQAFNQTQSQALQNVSQVLQSLQEQQSQILAALLPLQPLLQAVPVHIDSARSSINESMLKLSLESTRLHRSPPQTSQPPEVVRKRSFPTGPPPSPPLKRPRVEQEKNVLHRLTLNAATGDHPSPKPASRRLSFLANGRYSSLCGPCFPPVPRTTPVHRTPSFKNPLRDLSAPRRPLGDLPIPSENNNVQSSPYIRSPSTETYPLQRTPFLPRSLLRTLPHIMPKTPPLPNENTEGKSLLDTVTPQRPAAPVAPLSVAPSNLVPEEPLAPQSTNPRPPTSLNTLVGTEPSVAKNVPRAAGVNGQHSSAPVAVKATMVRERRSPFRDGRRFIPLDDDDDSGSEDD